jgi:hypothetical protein
MADEHRAEAAEKERAMREHEEEARKRDPDERREGKDGDATEHGGPPANIQPGTNTGS